MKQETYYSTPNGLEIIREKLNKLKTDHKEALEDLKNSQSNNTDLSENNEYLEAKDRLDKIDNEKVKLEDRYSRTKVINPKDYSNLNKVGFGLIVSVYDLDTEEEFQYQIVGEEESNIKDGKISYLSPLAKSIIGKEVGEEVFFDLPNGKDRNIEITDIKKAL